MALDNQKNREFKIVGKRPNRPDGLDKVTGRAKFGADAYATGMLHAAILRFSSCACQNSEYKQQTKQKL